MTIDEIISKIRRKGDIRLGPADRLQIRKCSRELKQLVRMNEYAVKAILKDERAARRCEASGRDPRWWAADDASRPEPGDPDVVYPACTCHEFPFPHLRHADGSGPGSTHVLNLYDPCQSHGSAGAGWGHQEGAREWRRASTTDRKPAVSVFTEQPYPPLCGIQAWGETPTELLPGDEREEVE